MKSFLLTILLVLTIACLIFPIGSEAGWESGFDPNNIMTDEYLAETGTMKVEEIQDFLETQPGILATYRTRDIKGTEKSAAEIFSDVANQFKMNPRVLLALVEKEQRLLTNPSPSQKSLNWATGFGSYGHKRYGGFAHQVYYAGKVLAPGGDYDTYQDHYKSFQIGKTTVTLDGYKVTPVNRATCKGYIYNPLVGNPKARFGANWLLWHLLNVRYKEAFAKYDGDGQVTGESSGSSFPSYGRYFYRDGTTIKLADSNDIYVVENGQRLLLTGPNAWKLRYHPAEVVTVSPEEFASYTDGGKIGLPDGVAVQRQKGGAVYIVSDGVLRGVADIETLNNLGYTRGNIIKITNAEANFHKVGPELEADSVTRLNGQIVQIAGQRGAYQYKDGKLLPIWHYKVKNINFEHVPIAVISESEAKGYQIMSRNPTSVRDGSLLMTTEGPQRGAVFVISGGRRYGFKSRTVFEEAGYNMKNVVVVPRDVLEIHPEGRNIERF